MNSQLRAVMLGHAQADRPDIVEGDRGNTGEIASEVPMQPLPAHAVPVEPAIVLPIAFLLIWLKRLK